MFAHIKERTSRAGFLGCWYIATRHTLNTAYTLPAAVKTFRWERIVETVLETVAGSPENCSSALLEL